jgi:ubiquitin-conjugating enzyme E2 Z
MSSKRLKRIINEIKELQDSTKILEDSGIFFHYDENNINNIYAMFIGPEKTPYEKGFYFLKFEYSENYPMEPPIAKYCTQGYLTNPSTNSNFSVRFNPNLYSCGKVCLSMLNTWNGPGWVPTNTMSNVLISIQALVLTEEPLRNEPGFEHSSSKEINKYNQIIEYSNIKISILEMITKPPPEFSIFRNKMCDIFIKNIDYYKNFCINKKTELKKNIIESAYYMKVFLDYESLLVKINELENKIINNELVDEIQELKILNEKEGY